MGLRDAGRNKGKRLAIIANPLEPERVPWWVCEPSGRTPSQGWWWIPRGAAVPEFLGHNAAISEAQLVHLVDAQLAPR
jgi:hypothetical protein